MFTPGRKAGRGMGKGEEEEIGSGKRKGKGNEVDGCSKAKMVLGGWG